MSWELHVLFWDQWKRGNSWHNYATKANFLFHNVNFLFISVNIPLAPTCIYGVFILRFICHANFKHCTRFLIIRFLELGNVTTRLKSSLQNFMVVTFISWMVMVGNPPAPWELICTPCHSFLFLFYLSLMWHFMSNKANRGCLPYQCIWVHDPRF